MKGKILLLALTAISFFASSEERKISSVFKDKLKSLETLVYYDLSLEIVQEGEVSSGAVYNFSLKTSDIEKKIVHIYPLNSYSLINGKKTAFPAEKIIFTLENNTPKLINKSDKNREDMYLFEYIKGLLFWESKKRIMLKDLTKKGSFEVRSNSSKLIFSKYHVVNITNNFLECEFSHKKRPFNNSSIMLPAVRGKIKMNLVTGLITSANVKQTFNFNGKKLVYHFKIKQRSK